MVSSVDTRTTSHSARDEPGIVNALVPDELSRIGEERGGDLRLQACISFECQCKTMKTKVTGMGGGCPILLSVSVGEGESGESLALKSVWDFCAWALGPLLSWAAWPGNIRGPPDASYYTLDVIQAFRRHGSCTEDSDPILKDTNGGDGRNTGREKAGGLQLWQ